MISDSCSTLIRLLADAESLSTLRNARCTSESVVQVREALKDVPARIGAVPDPDLRQAVETELQYHLTSFVRSFALLLDNQKYWSGRQQWHWARLSREFLPIERFIATETRNYICLRVDAHEADKIFALAGVGVDLDVLPPDGLRALQKTLSMDDRVVTNSHAYYARCVEILVDAGALVTTDLVPLAQTAQVRAILDAAYLRQQVIPGAATPARINRKMT